MTKLLLLDVLPLQAQTCIKQSGPQCSIRWIKQESCLIQVKEMQLDCERGLQSFSWSAQHDSQRPWMFESNNRPKNSDNPKRNLAIIAAATSIYSTCNFIMSTENVPCF
ncbi:hypothetical protein F0562_021606 [Nyssa sinensis]|uniref:Uncharacterized protein n=1 Tax=Nyssa sinensis TaxID=561372 RepID=A0A5J5BLT3_9ASTE|nr:hypothetical protein F0562_021606 [Nyssa sinensis]